MCALKTPINYQILEEELHAALEADELYKLQNDAKIRAIEQGTPTYEHFRQMVNGAHLKALDRDDIKPKIGVRWNPVINNANRLTAYTKSEKSKYGKNDYKLTTKEKSSETCESFLKIWKTIESQSEKFKYIWNQRNILRTHIFRVEISSLFLNGFIDVCLQHLPNVDDIIPLTELLDILSTCNRFDLAICFMTRNEQFACKQLFQQLQHKSVLQNKSLENVIKSLATKYQIKLT